MKGAVHGILHCGRSSVHTYSHTLAYTETGAVYACIVCTLYLPLAVGSHS